MRWLTSIPIWQAHPLHDEPPQPTWMRRWSRRMAQVDKLMPYLHLAGAKRL